MSVISTQKTTAAATARPAQRKPAVRSSLLLGLVTQILLIGLPLLDLWVLGSIRGHVQAAYPHWGPADVDADTAAIAITMVAVGVAGLLCWSAALFLTRRGRGMRPVITSMFAVGVSTLTVVAGYADGPYHPIVPLWLGATTLLVATATGATALVAAWRSRR